MTAAIEPSYSYRPAPSASQDLNGGAVASGAAATPSGTYIALRIKRSIDITVGITAGVLALPAMLLIAAAIRLDSPGPALFKANRIGRHGKPFAMYKFRTMFHGAELRLHEYAHLNVATRMVKIPDDPRVTRTGKWLRRFSLDELPQLYNIVAGNMSLVGPRPHDVHDLPLHGLEQEPRFGMRPGLTGLWQVNARSNPSLESRIHWDLQYVNNWSLFLDAKLIAKTVPAVVLPKGGRVDHVQQLVPRTFRSAAPEDGEIAIATGETGVQTTRRPEIDVDALAGLATGE